MVRRWISLYSSDTPSTIAVMQPKIEMPPRPTSRAMRLSSWSDISPSTSANRSTPIAASTMA